jgi:hypothetical protein
MSFLAPSLPKPIPPPIPPSLASGQIAMSMQQQAAAAAAAEGMGGEGTISTSPEGAESPNTAGIGLKANLGG